MNDPKNIETALAASFAEMMAACDRRTERWRPAVEDAPTMGACPACGAEGAGPLDFPESLEQSVQRDELRLVYAACDGCEAEAGVRERLARYGVPKRVRHARFGNFETDGEAKRERALEAVRDWVRHLAGENPREWALLLLGGCGTGKGHLAAAIIRATGRSARWTTHVDLLGDWHAADFSERQRIIARLRAAPLLVVDEIGGKNLTADTPELFSRLVDARYDAGAPTVFIGNVPLRARTAGGLDLLTILGGERAESRLRAGHRLVHCNWADYRGRI